MSYQNREQVIYKEKTKLIAIHPQESPSHFIRIEPSSHPFQRPFDIIISLFVITCVLSWLLPLLAIVIKLESKGPVFFIQKRVGAFGKIFHCIKLRTMVVNAEANLEQAKVNDPRITT